jgi:hypothetical protein
MRGNRVRLRSASAAILLAASALTAGTTAQAAAAAPAAPPPDLSATITAPSPLRVGNEVRVAITGLSRGHADARVNIQAPDGSTRQQTARPRCAAAVAAGQPARCRTVLKLRVDTTGTWTVTVVRGTQTLATRTLTVRPSTRPWAPPASWVQPAGWAILGGYGGATWAPCSTIAWFLDPDGAPASTTGMHDEITSALTALSAETGLTFTEMAPADAVNGRQPYLLSPGATSTPCTATGH